MTTITGKTPQKANIFFVKGNDHGGVVLLGNTVENDDNVILTINSKAYDEEARKWVDDSEVYEGAETYLKSLGASSVETAVDDLNALALIGSLTLPEVYVSGDIAKLTPITGGFVTYDKIDKSLALKIKSNKDEVFETIDLSDYKGYRFTVGVNVDGHNIRISQFVFEDESGDIDDEIDPVGVKYTNKQIDGLREDLKDGRVNGPTVEAVNNMITKLVASERAKRVATLTELFGKDFDKMIEDGDTIKGRVRAVKSPFGGYYAQMILPSK